MTATNRVATSALAAALAGTLVTADLTACTTFCVTSDGQVLFGRNYDFDFGRGVLLVNPRGLHKTGMQPQGPRWTARHGSLTFNQFGRDQPMGGMNEAGLVVELMWHDQAQYPAADSRAPVGVLEWIQYQLDTAATVDDVLKSDRRVRISGQTPLHYLVSDAAGQAATIEFLNGSLHARTGATLAARVLANDTYDKELDGWRRRQGTRAGGPSSQARFARAADAVASFHATTPSDAIDRAFAILADVAQSNTRWSIVYDQTARAVRFRTDTHAPIRHLALSRIDFTCRAGARGLDLNARLQGDVAAALEPYTQAKNRALIEASYRDFSATRRTPASEIDRDSAHPFTASCGSPSLDANPVR
jgi:choloylglycine hydrolase